VLDYWHGVGESQDLMLEIIFKREELVVAKIYPSLMSADLLNLQKEIEILERSNIAGYHIDIMDDHFVPNLTWGKMFVQAFASVTSKPLWVHLMVDNYHRWVDLLLPILNADSIVTFHFESKNKFKEVSSLIEKNNFIPSIAIKPKTPVEEVFSFLDVIHHVLVMSVEPGFSGQPFLPEVIQKVDTLVSACQINGSDVTIAMDGGIKEDNIYMLAQKGVEDFAVGSGIFNYEDRIAAVKRLYDLANKK